MAPLARSAPTSSSNAAPGAAAPGLRRKRSPPPARPRARGRAAPTPVSRRRSSSSLGASSRSLFLVVSRPPFSRRSVLPLRPGRPRRPLPRPPSPSCCGASIWRRLHRSSSRPSCAVGAGTTRTTSPRLMMPQRSTRAVMPPWPRTAWKPPSPSASSILEEGPHGPVPTRMTPLQMAKWSSTSASRLIPETARLRRSCDGAAVKRLRVGSWNSPVFDFRTSARGPHARFATGPALSRVTTILLRSCKMYQ